MRFRKSIEVSRSPADVFAYVADFSNMAEWDPGIVEARRLTGEPVAVGSRFEVVAAFRGKHHRFEYVVTELEEGRRIALHGEGERVASDDTVVVEPSEAGTRLTYEADIRMKGPARLASPVLRPMFARMGDRALASLRAKLDATS